MTAYVHVPAGDQLRAAISILTSAAAERQWGTGERVDVRAGGRLQLGDEPQVVDAAAVYLAARGLVSALLGDLCAATDRELGDFVSAWLLALQVNEAVADVDVPAGRTDGNG